MSPLTDALRRKADRVIDGRTVFHGAMTTAEAAAWTRPAGDAVEHPSHYTSHPSGVECIEITRHMNFPLGNAVKYIWRADLKHDAIEDLRKARTYLDIEIKRREEIANAALTECVG